MNTRPNVMPQTRGVIFTWTGLCSLAVVCVLACTAFTARAGATIRLEPDSPGPYTPYQLITVEVWIDNPELFELPLHRVQLDFSDTSTAINLPTSLTWLLTPPSAGNPDLPVPVWLESATPQNTVPAQGSLQVAELSLRLPRVVGCYRLDVMNRFDSDAARGAEILYEGASGNVLLRAYWWNLRGGAIGFPIGITPGTEVCNDVDDDCDGLIDEDLTVSVFDPFTQQYVDIGHGGPCVVGVGHCEVAGTWQCDAGGTGLECIPLTTPPPPQTEGPYGGSTCYDLLDNDCDGLVDADDPDCQGEEFCDGCDNDNDGEIDEEWPLLGTPCVVGKGACEKEGVWVCKQDGTGITCSVTPLLTINEWEGPPDHPNCFDGLDNDCDDLIDVRDPDCQQPEVCDGLDNNGDGEADEPWLDVLGAPCVLGVGACERQGIYVCNADGTDVICSVSPGGPTPEGPGCDCGDGIDNDCDGLTDLDDPDCGASVFRARAALPTICQPTADDCRSWHVIQYDTLSGGPGTTVEAEILALDVDGTILDTLPVNNGDEVSFRSRVLPADLYVGTTSYTIDGGLMLKWGDCMRGPDVPSVAYEAECVPYDTDCDDDGDLVDVAELQAQTGTVVTYHEVYAPVPLLRVRASDGVGQATAYASIVPHIRVWDPDDTVVSIAEGDRLQVNVALPNILPESLDLKLDGVGVFAALGLDPATAFPGGPYGGIVSLPNGCPAQICELVVDTASRETLAAHSLRMVVEGMCCGGHMFLITGDPDPTSYPDPAPPDCAIDDFEARGVSHGFEVEISAPTEGQAEYGPPVFVSGTICHGMPLEQSQMAPSTVFLNGLAVGTNNPVLYPGDGVTTAEKYSYFFTATLPETDLFSDFLGNGVPGTIDRGSTGLVAEARDLGANAAFDRVHFTLGPVLEGPARAERDTRTPIARGLTLSTTAAALDTVVTNVVRDFSPALIEEAVNMLMSVQGLQFSVPTDVCDPTVTVFPPFSIPPLAVYPPEISAFVTDVTTGTDQITATVTVPPARVVGKILGSCEIEGIFGECAIRVVVSVQLDLQLDEAVLGLTITEDDLLTGAAVVPTLTIDPNDVHITIVDFGSDVQCWAGELLNVLSFGLLESVAEQVLYDIVQGYIDDIDVTQYLGLIEVPPIPLDFLQIDPIDLGALNVQLDLALTEVDITPTGLGVGVSTEFIPTVIDPEVQVQLGTPYTPAALPVPPLLSPARGATLLVSEDAVNQMLYALTRNGLFGTQYEDVRTLLSFTPPNCSTLSTDVEIGQCIALKGLACDLAPPGIGQFSCESTTALLDALNIEPTTPIILHGRLDIAPTFHAFRALDNDTIIAYLRLTEVYVGALADRDGDGIVNDDYGTYPSCFGNPATETPCVLYGGCFDVNFVVQMTYSTPGGAHQIDFSVVGVNLSNATGCQGATITPGSMPGLLDIFEGLVFDLIQQHVNDNLPPLTLEGLDFGGVVNLLNLSVLTYGNEYDTIFEDYFGITADPD